MGTSSSGCSSRPGVGGGLVPEFNVMSSRGLFRALMRVLLTGPVGRGSLRHGFFDPTFRGTANATVLGHVDGARSTCDKTLSRSDFRTYAP